MNKIHLSASALFLVGSMICSSCSSLSRNHEESPPPQETDAQKIERLQNQNKELAGSLSSLSAKLDSLETKLSSMNEKLELNRARMDTMVENTRAKPGPLKTVPTEGPAALPPAGEDDAEMAFSSDQAVRKYRQAMILFQSHNFPEASLGFSAFVEQYPDHPLAGSAQYYLGESYFKQNEYKLAAREFSRVITTYDRSPHIAETLRDLATSEDRIGQPEEADRYRQLLTSLFPHSPAAHGSAAELSAAETPASAPAAPSTAEARPAPSVPAVPPATGATAAAEKSTAGALDEPPPTAPMSGSGSSTSGSPASSAGGSEK